MSDLTKKEIEIVQRLADGESVPEVAEKMELNYDYTKNLLVKIRRKMRCENSYNMVATAIRQGLID